MPIVWIWLPFNDIFSFSICPFSLKSTLWRMEGALMTTGTFLMSAVGRQWATLLFCSFERPKCHSVTSWAMDGSESFFVSGIGAYIFSERHDKEWSWVNMQSPGIVCCDDGFCTIPKTWYQGQGILLLIEIGWNVWIQKRNCTVRTNAASDSWMREMCFYKRCFRNVPIHLFVFVLLVDNKLLWPQTKK